MNPLQAESRGLTVARIETLGFRSLRHVSQRLGPFRVLVGPNTSGKSAFHDVPAFLVIRPEMKRTLRDTA